MASELDLEVARRRTFAIISHPDAGKTTLTEKLLLYGGAIHLAGGVRGGGAGDGDERPHADGAAVADTGFPGGASGVGGALHGSPGGTGWRPPHPSAL